MNQDRRLPGRSSVRAAAGLWGCGERAQVWAGTRHPHALSVRGRDWRVEPLTQASGRWVPTRPRSQTVESWGRLEREGPGLEVPFQNGWSCCTECGGHSSASDGSLRLPFGEAGPGFGVMNPFLSSRAETTPGRCQRTASSRPRAREGTRRDKPPQKSGACHLSARGDALVEKHTVY